MIKPNRGILWYDFVSCKDSSNNLVGMPLKRIKELFPDAEIKAWPVTLNPKISKIVTDIHPSLYTIFNLNPFFRSHLLCWIKKVNKK